MIPDVCVLPVFTMATTDGCIRMTMADIRIQMVLVVEDPEARS